jgi:uncharacterized protein YdaU (DUF1376 family)
LNLPHIQFYVGDWRKDLGIQTLSFYHRGVWFELLMLMHCSEQRGKLVLAGKPMPNAALARLLGLSQQETQDALAAILDSGVASKDEAGFVYCRRMVREEDLRKTRKQAGSIGGSKTASKREATPDNDIGTGLERVREFARERGISEKDADWFYWKGQGNGWTNGGKPMLDWKATLLSWQRAGYLPSQKQSRNGQQSTFQKPKERAPTYPKLPEKREPTDDEYKQAGEIAKDEIAKLKTQLNR